MKKVLMISNKCLLNLANCFSDSDELKTFIEHMEATMREVTFLSLLRQRIEEDEGPAAVMKEVAVVSLFCREHMELIQQLIRNLEGKEITEDQLKEIMDGDEMEENR